EAERRRVATLLEAEAGKLQSMVSGLLDLERLPLRDFATSTSVVDLSTVAADRALFLRAGTDRRIETSIAPGVYIKGDAALIERVIDNLVGNALKYAPQSTVNVVVARRDGAAVLEVEDQGRGIARVEHERIFERFMRGSSAAGTEGLGLGLSLVGEVARWHGGQASAHDGKSGGALFRVTLPIAGEVMRAGAM
ncbi:MAG TPA: HAMP domain-containing sensor histidine kinase, partial [Thermoanaerobaculia bacterium]|nr:HAMP domain-containing sensor histidine kinase [Thermoanaerobaculia bacterium]